MGFQDRYVGSNGDEILVTGDTSKHKEHGIIKVILYPTGTSDLTANNEPFWAWLDALIQDNYGENYELNRYPGSDGFVVWYVLPADCHN